MNIDIGTSVAIASAFVAACALGVTIWQGRQNYKHNKLSVRPLLTTMVQQDDNDNVSRVVFELGNCGVGPAIIKNFVLLDGDKEVSRNSHMSYREFLGDICDGCMNIQTGQYFPSAVMQAGEKLLLLSFEYDKKFTNIKFVGKLNLLVEYQSIYEDEVFTYDSRDDRRHRGGEGWL